MIIAHSFSVGTDAVVTPAVYTKSSLLVAVPPGAVTVIFPVEPFPTFAVIFVDESMVKEEASVPPNLTPNATPRLAMGALAAVLVKFVPIIVTVIPVPPDVGEKDVIVGGGGVAEYATV